MHNIVHAQPVENELNKNTKYVYFILFAIILHFYGFTYLHLKVADSNRNRVHKKVIIIDNKIKILDNNLLSLHQDVIDEFNKLNKTITQLFDDDTQEAVIKPEADITQDDVINPNMTIIDVINNDTIVQFIEQFVNGYSHYKIEGILPKSIPKKICNIEYLRENMYVEEKCGKSYKKDNIMVKLPEAMYCDKGNIHNSISNIHERFDISPNISIIKIDNYIECNEIEFNRIFNICNIEVLLYYILEIFKAYDEKRLPKIHPYLNQGGSYTKVLSSFNFYNSF